MAVEKENIDIVKLLLTNDALDVNTYDILWIFFLNYILIIIFQWYLNINYFNSINNIIVLMGFKIAIFLRHFNINSLIEFIINYIDIVPFKIIE